MFGLLPTDDSGLNGTLQKHGYLINVDDNMRAYLLRNLVDQIFDTDNIRCKINVGFTQTSRRELYKSMTTASTNGSLILAVEKRSTSPPVVVGFLIMTKTDVTTEACQIEIQSVCSFEQGVGKKLMELVHPIASVSCSLSTVQVYLVDASGIEGYYRKLGYTKTGFYEEYMLEKTF